MSRDYLASPVPAGIYPPRNSSSNPSPGSTQKKPYVRLGRDICVDNTAVKPASFFFRIRHVLANLFLSQGRQARTLEVISPLENTLNPEATADEVDSARLRNWGKRELTPYVVAGLRDQSANAARWSVDVKPRLTDEERSASRRGSHKTFQLQRIKSLLHFRKLAWNDFKALANPDEFPRAMIRSNNHFDYFYKHHFSLGLASKNSIGESDIYTSTDLWDVHNFAMAQAVVAGVESAVTGNAIPPASAPQYKTRLDTMCREINYDIMRATGTLKPAIARN